MRASTVVVAIALLGAFACGRFGEDTPPADETPSIDDAGTKKKDGAAAAPDAAIGTDALAPPPGLPAGAFDDITYDKVDDFERDDTEQGPFDWDLVGNGDHAGQTVCGESEGCSKDHVYFSENFGGDLGFVTTNLDSDTQILRFDFLLKIGTSDQEAGGHVQLVSIEMGGSNQYIFFELLGKTLRLGDQFRKDEGDMYQSDFTELGPVSFGKWEHYRLYVSLALGLAAVSREGAPLGPFRILRPESIGKPKKLRLGITFVENGDFFLQYDDAGMKETKN